VVATRNVTEVAVDGFRKSSTHPTRAITFANHVDLVHGEKTKKKGM
jgi:hypothetical protein